jgi:hypothetical protein
MYTHFKNYFQASNAINNRIRPTIDGAIKSALVQMSFATWLIAMTPVNKNKYNFILKL